MGVQPVSDSDIIDAIRAAMWESLIVDGAPSTRINTASRTLDLLRAAGFDVARSGTVRLGQAVEAARPFSDIGEYGWVAVPMPDSRLHASLTAQVLLDMLHERAGIKRGEL